MGGAFAHRMGVLNPVPQGFGTIVYVGGIADAWANTTSPDLDLTSLTGGLGGPLAENDYVLVFFAIADVSAATPADPTMVSAGYDPLHAVLSRSDINSSRFRSWAKFMGSSPDTTIDLGDMTGDQSAAVSVRVYRNVDLSNPLDVAVVTAGGNNTGQPNPGAITPVTVGAAVVMAAFASSSDNMTSAEVVNEIDAYQTATGGHCGAGMLTGDALDWVSGEVNPTTSNGDTNSNNTWHAITLALRPAPA